MESLARAQHFPIVVRGIYTLYLHADFDSNAQHVSRFVSVRQTNHRWVKYLQGINKPGTPNIFRTIYAQHLFDTWNATHNEAEQIQLLELLRFRQVIVPEGEGVHFATDVFGLVRAEDTRVEDTIRWDTPWKGS